MSVSLILRYICCVLMAVFASGAFSQAHPTVGGAGSEQAPQIAPRELIVLKATTEQVFGTWVAAVIHRGKTPQEVSFVANLPREVVDFQPGEGLTAKDMSLSDKGLTVTKTFDPGVNVLSVTFRLDANFGEATLTLQPPRDVPELMVMTPSGMLDIAADGLMKQGTESQEGRSYTVYGVTKPLVAGQPFVMKIQGVPEGRRRLWFVGGICGLLLAIAAAGLAWKTRPDVLRDNLLGDGGEKT